MIQFFDMFSGIGGFCAGPVHALDLRIKAAHEASVGETGARKETAG